MRGSKNAKSLLLAALLCWQNLAAAGAYGISVDYAQLRVDDGRAALDAGIVYRLTPKVLKTLQNGISLTWVLRVQVFRERRYWWDECVADAERHYRLRYQALMNAYEVRDESRGEADYFSTLPAALEALGNIRGLQLPELSALAADAVYRARMRMQLDKESLPLPLRPASYVSSDWYLSSGWYTWSVAP